MRPFWSRRRRDGVEQGDQEPIIEPGMSESAAVAIAAATPRHRVRIVGDVVQMRMRPTVALPALAVTIDDGSGTAVAVFGGRRSIGGVTLGRRLAVEGVPVWKGSQLEFTNPAITLLPPSGHA